MDEQREIEVPADSKQGDRGPAVRFMDAGEFRRLGLLQELNRQFLHPRGLALEVVLGGGTGLYFRVERDGLWESRELSELTVEEIVRVIVAEHPPERIATLIHSLAQIASDAPEHFGRVWDYRDDPEGLMFGPPDMSLSGDAARYANELLERHRPGREKLFGPSLIQPVADPVAGDAGLGRATGEADRG